MNSTKQLKWLMLILVSTSSFPPTAHSEVWIEEVQQAELPLALLSTKPTKIVLNQDGSVGSGTTATLVGGQNLAGQYRITSNSNNPITIDLISDDNVNNISLKNFILKYGNQTYTKFPIKGLPNPGVNGAYVSVGFTTNIKPGAPEGTSEPAFTIEVTEDRR